MTARKDGRQNKIRENQLEDERKEKAGAIDRKLKRKIDEKSRLMAYDRDRKRLRMLTPQAFVNYSSSAM